MRNKLQKLDDTWSLYLTTLIDYKNRQVITKFSSEFVIELGYGLDDVLVLSKELMIITGNLREFKKKEYTDKQNHFHNSILEMYNDDIEDLKTRILLLAKPIKNKRKKIK